ncbi:Amuc_1098 family type IV pilus outer membrane protein [Luteolibacter algae]|uniref:Amuc_1098 family type IV pilus outer membrane protein n=1 Tax=Luteolibacter algae TaxID=454151 RepID=A0ABW5D5A3_9BACT
MAFLIRNELSCRCFVYTLPLILMGASIAQNSQSSSALVNQELQRRQMAVQEGQMLLEKGDKAYTEGDYEAASAAYAGARQAFPDAPATAELRAAATQRYAQASVELSKMLSRKGDVEGAKAAMDKVLLDDVAPDNIEAKGMLADLQDPIRTNPALTKEHGADVDEVRRLIYTAQGAYDLGKYDQANEIYKDVLRIDPYNKAARRGMERISSQKANYLNTAKDHTRAEALAQVGSAWELPLEPELVIPDLVDSDVRDASGDLIPLENKLSRIVIPEFRVEESTLMEAIDLLRLRIAENDQFATDSSNKGINITINLGDPASSPAKEILAKTFDLQVSNVPVEKILNYIADITGTTFKTDDFAVIISPAGSGSDELITRTYRVSPDFMSNLASGSSNESDTGDIFNTEIGKGGLLPKRVSPQEALSQQGVSFPDGALASFNGATNTLRVVNTPDNQDIIQQIVETISQTEPVSVAVRVTMIKVERNILEELSFDWMLDTFEFGGDSWIPGASQLNLSGGTVGSGSPITDIAQAPGTFLPGNPITAGNRSGDGAFSSSSIDSIIAAGSSRGTQTNNRAPGVLGVNGTISNATVQMLMRGLDQKKGVDLMAQPSVTTRSGQAASIKVIREFIYPTEYEPPELPNTISGTTTIRIEDGEVTDISSSTPQSPVTPATPTAFETRDVGVTLEVLPVADANRQFVDVTLNPSITDFDGFVNYGSPITTTRNGLLGPEQRVLTENAILMPVFSVRKTNSNLVVADGATIVIGGLMKDEISTVNDKTPVLGDIPVVGRLFQSDAKRHTSTAILFLVNVELLDPTGRRYSDR